MLASAALWSLTLQQRSSNNTAREVIGRVVVIVLVVVVVIIVIVVIVLVVVVVVVVVLVVVVVVVAFDNFQHGNVQQFQGSPPVGWPHWLHPQVPICNRHGQTNFNRNTTFDSNGPDGRLRGNALQLYEKYTALAHPEWRPDCKNIALGHPGSKPTF